MTPTCPDLELRHHQVAVGNTSLHVVEAGHPDGTPVLFVHGWPQSWRTWQQVMALASPQTRVLAVDLPGIGRSTGDPTDGSKQQLAATLHQLIQALELEDLVLVGHDAGALVVYPYARSYPLRAAVLIDVPVPGVDPWDQLMANPHLWHFAFHATPGLPEQLVQGRQRTYFDFFYDAFSQNPAAITDEARTAYVHAYTSGEALTAGFSWYRTIPADAIANQQSSQGPPTDTPVLLLLAETSGAMINSYADGYRHAGLTALQHAVIPGAGHFIQEEAPDELWRQISSFVRL